MRFNLYSGEDCVGWSDLPHADPPMGVVFGSLYPNDAYTKIQAIIREFHLYDGSFGETNDKKLQNVRQKIQTLNLEVRTEAGDVLEPVGGVHLIDFTEELEDEPIQLSVLGLPREQFLQYWQEADEQYENQYQ